jgi:uncharacterized membrane protein
MECGCAAGSRAPAILGAHYCNDDGRFVGSELHTACNGFRISNDMQTAVNIGIGYRHQRSARALE